MSITDTVRAAFAAYLAQDAVAARPLYSEDFRFSSPQDDGLDKDSFFITCFPTASWLRRQDLLELAAVGRTVCSWCTSTSSSPAGRTATRSS